LESDRDAVRDLRRRPVPVVSLESSVICLLARADRVATRRGRAAVGGDAREPGRDPAVGRWGAWHVR